jgi:hypothetical protein
VRGGYEGEPRGEEAKDFKPEIDALKKKKNAG